jgi:hypothetical protein
MRAAQGRPPRYWVVEPAPRTLEFFGLTPHLRRAHQGTTVRVDRGLRPPRSVGVRPRSAAITRSAPCKARWGIDAYFTAWERAVAAFGPGQVSTYVILGMGEDVEVTVEGCKRAIDLGVYPFVVPLRPVPGSLMEHVRPPPREAVEAVYRRVVPHLLARGMSSAGVTAGCARCQACSGLGAFERSDRGIRDGRPSLPLIAH